MPTPALAHAVTANQAHAGVMVTASHNPRGDNGYKVYMADGAQLIPPADAEIEAAIVAAAETTLVLDVERQPRVDMVTPYLDAVERHLVAETDEPDLTVVYTAMHGVGSAALRALFARLGLPAPIVVPDQDEPDGTFPTTAFPNPEEPGALDLAFALAESVGADVVIANDPDADRLGIAVPGPEGWARLTGDELGLLLADSLLRRTTGDDRIVASSLVSSSALEALAARHGVPHEATLTGFKWVARVGQDTGRRLVFGYEEALGYAVTPAVHDKDGITAAAELVHLAADRKRRGSDLRGLLDELMAEIGVFVTAQRTKRVEGSGPLERLAAAMASLRSAPPPEIGGVSITATEDLLLGDGLPPSDVLIYRLLDGSRVILRPSGTEPKLKAYLEVTAPAGPDGPAATRAALTGRIRSLADSVEELLETRLD
jgi:phosphomannomutase